MSKKDKSQSNLLFPVPDSGDIASDVWRLIIRSNAKMLNLLLQECPEIAPGQNKQCQRNRREHHAEKHYNDRRRSGEPDKNG